MSEILKILGRGLTTRCRVVDPRNIVTVTQSPCAWCRRPVEQAGGPGRPRRYCRRSCRQRAFEARQRSTELGLGEHELVVTRERLDQLGDQLFVLRCAVEDVSATWPPSTGPPTVEDLRAALDWVLEATRPVLGWDGG